MKYSLTLLLLVIILYSSAQEKINPVIKNYGGIYDIPEATVRPDSDLEYKIIVDVYGGSDDVGKIDGSLNNVARMLNLHAVGGVDAKKIKVVLAIHAKSTYSTMNDEAYKAKFGISNPNTLLLKEMKDAGVKITVCGQSLISRELAYDQILPEVEIATSMLTTVTAYQLLGYAFLKF